MSEFLQIKNIECGYAKSFRIANLSTQFKRKSFNGIVGPNGSGKTTLFKAITGEIHIDSGSILLNNKDFTSFSIREKARKIAIVTQKTEATDITAEDYVLMGRIPHRKQFQMFETESDYEIAHRFMKLTDVFHFKNKLMNELSGGEQQLSAIARALTQEPELLLLDEPTSSLDIHHQIQILNLIQHLISELNLTAIMIIHDLNIAGEYCDKLIMMNNGQIHCEGDPAEVLTYKNIEDVYKTVVITQTNPLSGKPAVFPISDKILNSLKS